MQMRFSGNDWQEFLDGLKRRIVRKPFPLKRADHSATAQLPLRLHLKRLIKIACGIVWTRPDGKQLVCRSLRQLAARVMDYDGRLLKQMAPTIARLQ